MHQGNVIGAFSEVDASRLSGVTIGQLRDWDRKGFLRPSYAEENRALPYSRVYSCKETISLNE